MDSGSIEPDESHRSGSRTDRFKSVLFYFLCRIQEIEIGRIMNQYCINYIARFDYIWYNMEFNTIKLIKKEGIVSRPNEQIISA